MFKCLKKFKKEPKEIRPEIQNILDDLISNHDKWQKTSNRYTWGPGHLWVYLGEGFSSPSAFKLSIPYELRECEKQALARAIGDSIFLTETMKKTQER